MARPLRIEFPGAMYHITSRGDRRQPIFADDDDRHAFLQIVGAAFQRFDACAIAYCLMGNHYHFVIHTRQGNLSRLMRQINGVYTQAYNRRHAEVGHLFQGRFKAVLVDADAYLLEVCRYVDLNPVRAELVDRPDAWQWSSYAAHIGTAPGPAWLDSAALYGYVLGRPVAQAADVRAARTRYGRHVAQGVNVKLWDDALRQQIYLGNDAFIARMQAFAGAESLGSKEVPRSQRAVTTKPIGAYLRMRIPRNEAIVRAFREGGHTMTAIASEAGLSVAQVSRIIAAWERPD